MFFHPLSRANAATRSIGAFATTARLPPSPSKWGIVPSHMSMSAVHEGHGPSANGTCAMAPVVDPGRLSDEWRGNM
jgi:hypothetical protein